MILWFRLRPQHFQTHSFRPIFSWRCASEANKRSIVMLRRNCAIYMIASKNPLRLEMLSTFRWTEFFLAVFVLKAIDRLCSLVRWRPGLKTLDCNRKCSFGSNCKSDSQKNSRKVLIYIHTKPGFAKTRICTEHEIGKTCCWST